MTESLTVQQAERYLLAKPASTLYYPFGDDVKVFRVKQKMFATLSFGKGNEKDTGSKMAGYYCINLKCDPDEAVMLRDIFTSVIPGYHMNKAQWNTIILDGSIPRGEIERMMDNSFMLVVNKMTKKEQQSILLHL
ncbi:MmcQ/YjbR family DNA-binding protein [Colwellia sp. MSW7]|jgi:predicted DNA-binding protein (MmcQ/YjbR family)|uniref:MmcQ/YjbR family DNA-binding protein n=1 Tax=Colwellia maritima TaxID=2912588 RepID=A0ABS9X7F1_9GAMM|nr:MmcQ/YjbR family DNA-binding protein [Colwellia maritima]MCI2284972.1 MmcQ/YjbR family DNA-binding protein [Colwellia maritima]